MSSFNDIKDMWRKQEVSVPPAQEMISLARRSSTKMARKTVLVIIALTATVAFLAWIMFYYEFRYPTTKLGTALVILAVTAAIIIHSQLLGIIRKSASSAENSKEYLNHLIRYRSKSQFIQTTGMTIYFIVLAVGLALYLFEFLARDLVVGISAYVISFGWILFNWFWIRPRTVRKQQKQLAELIGRIEQLLGQLKEQ
jgi:hypothetical protein